ncbi:MAG TPA: glycosyltransferase family 4 protein [Parvularculaceae bacterium]|nr:glycosyltransferase family 4 protein [Parvularculaceae bacterium]
MKRFRAFPGVKAQRRGVQAASGISPKERCNFPSGLSRMPFDKTVLQVIPELDAGGAERTTVEMTRAIVAEGGRALVATKGGRLAPDIKAAGGKVFPMPVHSKNPFVIWANRKRLIDLIEKEKVDIIHVRSRAPAWSALWAAEATGKKLVATYHGAYGATNPLKKLYNSAMVRGDLVIANSAFTAAAIRAAYEVDWAKIKIIPRGADLEAFDPAGVQHARIDALTRRWGVRNDVRSFRLLLPARLTPWKGQSVAIEAIGQIASARRASGQRLELQLILAGDAQGRTKYAEALRRDIETRGVRDMVHLVGHCADMPAAIAWADAVLSPSTRPEAFGRVAVEAGAMGKPVIAADHGGARETIEDGVTGFLTPPGDAKALAEAIEKLMALDAVARQGMGARGRARVQRIYSSEAMCRSTMAAYTELTA